MERFLSILQCFKTCWEGPEWTLCKGYLLKPEWGIGERNEENDGNTGNQGGNDGDAGNQGGNDGNAGNQGGNAGNAENQRVKAEGGMRKLIWWESSYRSEIDEL